MRETGHHCSVCKKPCCNLCNKMEVDDITDILCPRCAEAGEFMGETGERENTTSDREGGGVMRVLQTQHLILPFLPPTVRTGMKSKGISQHQPVLILAVQRLS